MFLPSLLSAFILGPPYEVALIFILLLAGAFTPAALALTNDGLRVPKTSPAVRGLSYRLSLAFRC